MTLQTTIDRCVAARQWQHLSAITGQSEHRVRLTYDADYAALYAPAKPKKGRKKKTLSARETRFTVATLRRQRLNPSDAWDDDAAPDAALEAARLKRQAERAALNRQWVLMIRGRLEALNLPLSELARRIDITPRSLSAMMSPTGHVSARTRERMDAALSEIETTKRAA